MLLFKQGNSFSSYKDKLLLSTETQMKLDDLQEYNKCSWDSSSALQKAHKGDSTILNRWSFLLVKIIRFKMLYWNCLSLVSNIVSKAKEYNFFQLEMSGYFLKFLAYAVAGVCFKEQNSLSVLQLTCRYTVHVMYTWLYMNFCTKTSKTPFP